MTQRSAYTLSLKRCDGKAKDDINDRQTKYITIDANIIPLYEIC